MAKQKFLNTQIDNLCTEQVLAWVEETIPQKRSAYIIELNVDVIMKMEKDLELRSISDRADLALVDGKPLVWISKLLGEPVKEKISGSDLMPRMCALAAEKGYSIFILGGMGDTAQIAAENLQKQFPGLKVAGTDAPPFGFDKDEAETARISALLNEAKPDILFVCFGCPKQEKWLAANRDKFQAGVCLCAGASVDFAAGRVKRAPKWMSDHGLEWFYRFIKEPGRLFKRYFIDDMQIIRLVLKYR